MFSGQLGGGSRPLPGGAGVGKKVNPQDSPCGFAKWSVFSGQLSVFSLRLSLFTFHFPTVDAVDL